MTEFLELVRAIAWPAVAAAALYAFYKPLSTSIGELGKRATKISAFHVEVEFPALAQAQVASFSSDIKELRQGAEFSSSTMALLDQVRAEGPMDYAVIDLGRGKDWLSSRLFIFALILQRLRGLRCLVFVATTETGHPKHLVGLTTPDELRWALGARFPWLERSFAMAYQSTVLTVAGDQPFIFSKSGALSSVIATQLIANFLQLIQSPTKQDGWISLSGSTLWEHAEWIDRESAERNLGALLQRSSVNGSADRPRSEVIDSIIRSRGEFVALLEAQPSKRFLKLVDRYTLLEQVVERR
jgi:hypothetical protein